MRRSNGQPVAEAHRWWEETDARLTRLLGFNPATSNHYGHIRLYNQPICRKTTDEEIMAIRELFLRWRAGILSIFAENGVTMSIEDLGALSYADGMYGTLHFLDRPIDIHAGADLHRADILAFLTPKKQKVTKRMTPFKLQLERDRLTGKLPRPQKPQ